MVQRTKLSDEILALLSSLQPGCDEPTIVRTCNKMLKIFNDDPELPSHFVMNHGVIPIMELLEVSKLMAESFMGSILSVRSVKVRNGCGRSVNFASVCAAILFLLTFLSPLLRCFFLPSLSNSNSL